MNTHKANYNAEDSFTVSFHSDNTLSTPSRLETESEMPDELKMSEQVSLDCAELEITDDWPAFVNVGMLFNKIREDKLYRETHATFEEYFNDIVAEMTEHYARERREKLSAAKSAKPLSLALKEAEEFLAKNK